MRRVARARAFFSRAGPHLADCIAMRSQAPRALGLPMAVAVAIAITGCKKDAPPAPTRVEPVASVDVVYGEDRSQLSLKGPVPSKDGALSAQFGAQYLTFPSARAVVHPGYVQIEAWSKTVACGDEPPDDAVMIGFRIGPGPSSDFFAGRPVALPLDLRNVAGVGPMAGDTRVQLAPFTLVVGARITGKLGFSSARPSAQRGAGSFDAVVCPIDAVALARTLQTEPPSEAKIAGARGAEPFVVGSVIVRVSDAGLAPFVSDVDVYAAEGVECDAAFGVRIKQPRIELETGIPQSLLGAPQPARVSAYRAEEEATESVDTAWVRIDDVDLVAGSLAKGALFAAVASRDGKGAPVVRLAGRFQAKICRVAAIGSR